MIGPKFSLIAIFSSTVRTVMTSFRNYIQNVNGIGSSYITNSHDIIIKTERIDCLYFLIVDLNVLLVERRGHFHGDTFEVTPTVKADFDKYGYIVIRNLLDVEEVDKVIKEFEDPSTAELLNNNKVKVSDCQGREAKLTIWGHPGNDVSGMISRSEKVAGTCEQLLGDEVYHYHGKLVTKEPFTGGAHLWHQDYGYWYINEFLEPNMMTVFIALDKCEKRNGCLQIIESSHKCGRLDHKLEGQLTVTDPTRLDKIMDRFAMKYCLLNPGDALFFHCNLLHCSGQNSSAYRRWALLTVYNTVSNQSCKPHHHPQYIRLEKVPNTAIKSCDKFTDFTDKRILVPKTFDSKQVIPKTPA